LVVEVTGELDLQAVPLLDALGIDPCLVVLDLHGVTFMDCSGVRALLEARRRAVAAGGSLHLAAPSRHVLSLLTLTHLGRALPVFDSVSEAIATPVGVGAGYPRPRLVQRQRSGGDGERPE
jgi:anti-anti-sigma factor